MIIVEVKEKVSEYRQKIIFFFYGFSSRKIQKEFNFSYLRKDNNDKSQGEKIKLFNEEGGNI